jgi:hypothetical protein
MGSRLPSEEEVLIIRPTGKKGQPPLRSNGLGRSLPGAPCQESQGIPKQDPNNIAVQAECSL